MARLGVDLVFDCKMVDLGIQGHFENLILVDGSWYVNWMPQGLIDVSREAAAAEKIKGEAQVTMYRKEHPTKRPGPDDTKIASAARTLSESIEAAPDLQRRLDMREQYRMIPKGRRDKDGYQRFTYPPTHRTLVSPKIPPTVTSITVPPVLPDTEDVASGKTPGRKPKSERSDNSRSKSQPIKWAQPLPHKSLAWRAWYGMRNLVESSNNLLKSPAHGDIDNTKKRSGRGYAATFLALAFAVVASNMKRIATFFFAEAQRIEQAAVKHRTRRRRDELGAPLEHLESQAPPGSVA